MAGFAAARGRHIVMADADLTYDFGEIPRFLAELEAGADLVMGDRMDGIQPGAMPWLHRYIGNPLLSGTLNLFFRTGVRDAHCGMRAFRRERLPELDLRTTGMEFASEMVIRAAKAKLDIRQLPIDYHPRGGTSKLSSFRDGWRHLRFLLLHSPTHLFVIPGAALLLLGVLVGLVSLSRLELLGREWQLHSMIAGSLLAIVGTQVLGLGLCAHAYGSYFMGEREAWFDRMRARFRLEHGLLAGGAIAAAGALIAARHRRHVDPPRLRRALRGAAARRRLRADHRRAAGALLVASCSRSSGLRRRDDAPALAPRRCADVQHADPAVGLEQHDVRARPAASARNSKRAGEPGSIGSISPSPAARPPSSTSPRTASAEHVARAGAHARARSARVAEIVRSIRCEASGARRGRRRASAWRAASTAPVGGPSGRGARPSPARSGRAARPRGRGAGAQHATDAIRHVRTLPRAGVKVPARRADTSPCQNQGAKGKSSARARRKATELRMSQPGCHQVTM